MKHITIYEVGPRDGLQNESAFVPTNDKIRLIQALLASGVPKVEITSFVHPRWIPALADADEVASTCQKKHAIQYSSHLTALVPNERGMTRALSSQMKEIAVFMSASPTHNKRNINKTHDETYRAFEKVFQICDENHIKVRAYVSTVWGCPYEGKVDMNVSAEITERLLAMGAYEVSLGDTIGVGNPQQTGEVLNAIAQKVSLDRIAMHMHDTWGRALANCWVGLQAGVHTFDSSIGGLGGCPYAPGASGNLATEDLVHMLHEAGYSTGVDWDLLVQAGALAQDVMERPLSSKALMASLASMSKL